MALPLLLLLSFVAMLSASCKDCECPNKPKVICNKPHEHYHCGSACQTTCATLGEPCKVLNVKCNERCYCNAGYARDSNGECIRTWFCPEVKKCINPNEEFACSLACQTECHTLNETCPILNVRCNNKCYCKKGYARNFEGICIPVDECPEKHEHCNRICNRDNEHYACGPSCQRECSNLNKSCNDSKNGAKCQECCYCNKGYARDSNGHCVKTAGCPDRTSASKNSFYYKRRTNGSHLNSPSRKIHIQI